MNKQDTFGIVYSHFNSQLVGRLRAGALHFFEQEKREQSDIQMLEVPGAFELPLGAKWMLESNSALVGVVALGVIIRGETPHFDYVAGQSAAGIMRLSLDTGKPVGYGVITANTYAQAENRASLQSLDSDASPADAKKTKEKNITNSGYHAAAAVWNMVLAQRGLQSA